MLITIGMDISVFEREARNAMFFALATFHGACFNDPQDLLLIRPDQDPDVEQHDGAEPGANADRRRVGIRRARPSGLA